MIGTSRGAELQVIRLWADASDFGMKFELGAAVLVMERGPERLWRKESTVIRRTRQFKSQSTQDQEACGCDFRRSDSENKRRHRVSELWWD